jgi:hypothetical protein
VLPIALTLKFLLSIPSPVKFPVELLSSDCGFSTTS